MKKTGFWLFIMLAGLVLFSGASCKSKSSLAKKMDKINERKDENSKEAVAAYDKALKRHQSIQGKRSKKMIKASRKKSTRWMKKNIKSAPNCPAVN